MENHTSVSFHMEDLDPEAFRCEFVPKDTSCRAHFRVRLADHTIFLHQEKDLEIICHQIAVTGLLALAQSKLAALQTEKVVV